MMAVNGKDAAEYLLTQIGRPYEEQDCVEAVVINPIRRLPGGKKDYKTGGCTSLWNSIGASEKYRDIIERVPIAEAKARGLMIGELPCIYDAESGKCEHIAFYMGGIGGHECIHSSFTNGIVCSTTLKNGFTHVMQHRYITPVSVDEAATDAGARDENGGESMSAICKMQVVLESSKYLNLRNEPSSSGRDVGDIPNGAIVDVLVDGEWPYVRYERKTGYVCGKYLRFYDEPPEEAPAAEDEAQKQAGELRMVITDGKGEKFYPIGGFTVEMRVVED